MALDIRCPPRTDCGSISLHPIWSPQAPSGVIPACKGSSNPECCQVGQSRVTEGERGGLPGGHSVKGSRGAFTLGPPRCQGAAEF